MSEIPVPHVLFLPALLAPAAAAVFRLLGLRIRVVWNTSGKPRGRAQGRERAFRSCRRFRRSM